MIANLIIGILSLIKYTCNNIPNTVFDNRDNIPNTEFCERYTSVEFVVVIVGMFTAVFLFA